MSHRPKKIFELEVLEELFFDQLEFKLRAIFLLLTVARKQRREILSFIDQLTELTRENLDIIHKRTSA